MECVDSAAPQVESTPAEIDSGTARGGCVWSAADPGLCHHEDMWG